MEGGKCVEGIFNLYFAHYDRARPPELPSRRHGAKIAPLERHRQTARSILPAPAAEGEIVTRRSAGDLTTPRIGADTPEPRLSSPAPAVASSSDDEAPAAHGNVPNAVAPSDEATGAHPNGVMRIDTSTSGETVALIKVEEKMALAKMGA